MNTIVQLSDFHIKKTMGEPSNNPAFSSLIKTLTQIKNESDSNGRKFILVFCGDVIDHTSIYNQILKKNFSNDDKKANFWDKKAKEEYDLAYKYFQTLKNTLGISGDEMIVCCGNHDINCFRKLPEIKIKCDIHDYFYSPKRFDQYNAFLTELGIRADQRAEVFFTSIYDFNFLVINSNWLNKFEHNRDLCIDCSSIISKIELNKEKIRNSDKKRNVLVAHAPVSDYCEEAKGAYQCNNYNPAMKEVNQYFELKLFGDKHTNYEANGTILVGSPLDDSRITCSIHDFGDDQTCFHRCFIYEEGKGWQLDNISEYIDSIYKISEPFIKGKAMEYVFGHNEPLSLDDWKRYKDIRKENNWKYLDKLFLSSSKIVSPRDGQSGDLLQVDSDYIEYLSELISTSQQKVSLVVRGKVRLGKSVCMSVLYLNLLYQFACSQFKYIPIYINLEIIRRGFDDIVNRDTPGYMQKVVERVSEILRAGQEQCKKYGRKACCILDGLNQYSYYENAPIDDTIWGLLSDEENACYERIILCMDTGNEKLRHTELHIRRDAQYVVYFDPILTYSYHREERYNNFIDAYCGLRGISDANLKRTTEIIKNNVLKMKIPELTTSIMADLWDDLCNERYNDTYFHALSRVADQRITKNCKQIIKACHLSYVKQMEYTEIKSKCKIGNKSFDLIRTQPHIANYLQAKYYVENVSARFADKDPDFYPDQLLNHEISSLVRDYIHKINAENDILKYAERNYSSLSSTGRATLSFLIGRFSTDKEKINALLDSQEKQLNSAEAEKIKNGEHIDKYDRIARRSIRLSKIAMMPDSEKKGAVLKYIHELISDENARKVNRCFYLQFYGDRRIDSTQEEDDLIYEGFDLFKTYQVLVQRLRNQLENQNEQWLGALELFTICDLLQIRIDNEDVSSKNVKSFFYNPEKYNMPKDRMAHDVIGDVKELVEKYLEPYGEQEEDLFLEYLRHQKAIYDRILPILETRPLKKEDNILDPNGFLEELARLEKTKRMGWLFPEEIEGVITENEFLDRRKSDKCFETTLDHSYEMFLIGLLYLPQTSDSEGYNKKEILDIVLIHDLGESHTGDSVPFCENSDNIKDKEKEWCRNLYMQGVHEGIADLTYYWKLWDDWCSTTPSYNVKVAKDLDKLQLLYKLMKILVELDEKNVTYFHPKRIKQFWNERRAIGTKEVKAIYNIIIYGNNKFLNVAQKNGIIIKKLQSIN